MLPLYTWIWTGEDVLRSFWLVVPWVAFVAFLMVSSVATYSWSSLKLRRNVRFEAIVVAVVLAAALITAPWQTLTMVCVAYLATLPFSVRGYMRVRRLRAAPAAPESGVP